MNRVTKISALPALTADFLQASGLLIEWHLLKAIVRILRHSRAGGNPAVFAGILDSRLRGNDGMLELLWHKQ